MKIYATEENIDFFAELYKSLDIEENKQKTIEDENLCLITNELLTDKYVELCCGHKFNYISIYNDIKNHKQKFNHLEVSSSQLKFNEIRCPYCRNKQTELLPYYEELGLPKVHGVNFIDPDKKYKISNTLSKYNKCEYLTVNPLFDPSGNDPIEQGSKYHQQNCKFFSCCYSGYYKISKYIDGYIGEDKSVCYLHKNMMVKDTT